MRRFVFVLEQTLGHVAHTRNLERALAEEPGIDATVLKLNYREVSGLRRCLPGIRTWSFEASLGARSALLRRLQRGPADACFVHTQVAALLLPKLMRTIPTVVSLDATPRNFDEQGIAYGHRTGNGLLETAKLRLNRRALMGARYLVTWCRWAARSLIADYAIPEEKIRVIAPGVDVQLFRPPRARQPGPTRILFVGGDFARKGGPDLLEAVRRLKGEVELDLVTSSAVDFLPAGVGCRIHRGLQPQAPELVALYRQADVFALPSRGDCMPQAVAEALASGLPVVASDVGAIPEMVRDGVNGYLVPPGDPRRLAEALEALVANPERRAAFGRWSRVVAEQAHDASYNNRAIFALMAQAAGSTLALSRRPA